MTALTEILMRKQAARAKRPEGPLVGKITTKCVSQEKRTVEVSFYQWLMLNEMYTNGKGFSALVKDENRFADGHGAGFSYGVGEEMFHESTAFACHTRGLIIPVAYAVKNDLKRYRNPVVVALTFRGESVAQFDGLDETLKDKFKVQVPEEAWHTRLSPYVVLNWDVAAIAVNLGMTAIVYDEFPEDQVVKWNGYPKIADLTPQSARIQEEIEQNNIADLYGSPNQIKWADSIRAAALFGKKWPIQVRSKLSRVSDSTWWIANRGIIANGTFKEPSPRQLVSL